MPPKPSFYEYASCSQSPPVVCVSPSLSLSLPLSLSLSFTPSLSLDWPFWSKGCGDSFSSVCCCVCVNLARVLLCVRVACVVVLLRLYQFWSADDTPERQLGLHTTVCLMTFLLVDLFLVPRLLRRLCPHLCARVSTCCVCGGRCVCACKYIVQFSITAHDVYQV